MVTPSIPPQYAGWSLLLLASSACSGTVSPSVMEAAPPATPAATTASLLAPTASSPAPTVVGPSRAGFAKWRPAIENYEPLVRLDNTTALNDARVPFAKYINSMHNRIHPIFADEFLASLNRLSKESQLDPNLVTHVEIVLAQETGIVYKAQGALRRLRRFPRPFAYLTRRVQPPP